MESGLPGLHGVSALRHVALERGLVNVCVTIPPQPTAGEHVEVQRMKQRLVTLVIV